MEQIERKNVVVTKPTLTRPSRPKIQSTNDGWISVPQPDSSNPDDWYANDPFKK